MQQNLLEATGPLRRKSGIFEYRDSQCYLRRGRYLCWLSNPESSRLQAARMSVSIPREQAINSTIPDIPCILVLTERPLSGSPWSRLSREGKDWCSQRWRMETRRSRSNMKACRSHAFVAEHPQVQIYLRSARWRVKSNVLTVFMKGKKIHR